MACLWSICRCLRLVPSMSWTDFHCWFGSKTVTRARCSYNHTWTPLRKSNPRSTLNTHRCHKLLLWSAVNLLLRYRRHKGMLSVRPSVPFARWLHGMPASNCHRRGTSFRRAIPCYRRFVVPNQQHLDIREWHRNSYRGKSAVTAVIPAVMGRKCAVLPR